MPAGLWNIVAEQGATYARTVICRDSAGALIDLTSYTARMMVRASYAATDAVLSLTSSDGLTLGGAAGTIDILITAAQMAALTVADVGNIPAQTVFVYDLELVLSGVVTRLLNGKFTVTREVTR